MHDTPDINDTPDIMGIKKCLREQAVEFAVLVGSRATGRAQAQSDWDIALWLTPSLQGWQRQGALVDAQLKIAGVLGVCPDQVDIIDLQSAGLAMREQVVNHGIILVGGDRVSWARFQTHTWREIEEFHWGKRIYGY